MSNNKIVVIIFTVGASTLGVDFVRLSQDSRVVDTTIRLIKALGLSKNPTTLVVGVCQINSLNEVYDIL